MISSARITSQVKQLQQFDIAINQYKTSFNQLPGEYSGYTKGVISGSTLAGNNIYDSSCCQNVGGDYRLVGSEGLYFAIDLHERGFLKENYTTNGANSAPQVTYGSGGYLPEAVIRKSSNNGLIPSSNLMGDIFWFFLPPSLGQGGAWSANGTMLGSSADPAAYAWQESSVQTTDAIALDAKLDDGLPLSGDIVAVATPNNAPITSNSFYILPLTSDTNCINGTGYNLTTNKFCNIILKAKVY